jgi:hypothetical protein
LSSGYCRASVCAPPFKSRASLHSTLFPGSSGGPFSASFPKHVSLATLGSSVIGDLFWLLDFQSRNGLLPSLTSHGSQYTCGTPSPPVHRPFDATDHHLISRSGAPAVNLVDDERAHTKSTQMENWKMRGSATGPDLCLLWRVYSILGIKPGLPGQAFCTACWRHCNGCVVCSTCVYPETFPRHTAMISAPPEIPLPMATAAMKTEAVVGGPRFGCLELPGEA